MYKQLKYWFISCVFIIISGSLHAQNPKFDKLEMLFEQGHYKKVYRKSKRLLDDPAYDFSMLPKYYKSLSLMQLAQNDYWLIRNDKAIDDAQDLFLEVRRSEDAQKIFDSHLFELKWVRNDLLSWASDLKRRGLQSDFIRVQTLIDVVFEEIDGINDDEINNDVIDTLSIVIENTNNHSLRDEIVLTAKAQLGTPYVWAGSTPEGFDCSGFTSYVMSLNGEQLPRRSVDQYDSSKKVKAKNVNRGDLVFFDNGSGISHVGIIVSTPGEPLTMIHASTSSGVIVTVIPDSTYWSNRLAGFGTYVN